MPPITAEEISTAATAIISKGLEKLDPATTTTADASSAYSMDATAEVDKSSTK